MPDREQWGYEPMGAPFGFPYAVGKCPARAKGVTFVALRQYAEHRLDGGYDAALREIQPDYAEYLGQLFLVQADYDAGALMALFCALAELTGQPLGPFICRRSEQTAEADSRTLYRALLDKKDPVRVAERMPHMFQRYFPSCHADVGIIESGLLKAVLRAVPEPMAGLFVQSTKGFVSRCLQLAGAQDVAFHVEQPEPEPPSGAHRELRVPFQILWQGEA